MYRDLCSIHNIVLLQKSESSRTKTQEILSAECSSGDKERKLLSVFWLALIQLVFYLIEVYTKVISSNMNINENFTYRMGCSMRFFTILLTAIFRRLP